MWDAYLRQSGDFKNGLLLVLPLLVAYQGGLLWLGFANLNGVDFVTRFVYVHHGEKGVAIFGLSLLALFIVGIERQRTQARLEPWIIGPIVVESAIYAASLGTVVMLVLRGLSVPLAAPLALDLDPDALRALARVVVVSLGAGVNEEVFFRVLLLGGLVWVATEFLGLAKGQAVAVALIVSSAAFALAHHVGPHGEPLALGVALFRFLAGVAFGLIYRCRSFAVAVLSHALYDVFVLLPRAA